jgi:predicted deacetylase
MTGNHPTPCPRCGSQSVTDERLVEHECGHIASTEAFDDDDCPKCGRKATDESLTSQQTVERCLECGHRPPLHVDDETVGPLPSVSFPTLPAPGENLDWVPARLLPRSRVRRQALSTALVLMVLVAGIAGAVSVTPMLEGGSAAEASVDTDWEEYDSIVIFRNDDIQPWYNQDELRAVNDVFIEEEMPVTLGIIPDTGGGAPLTEDPELCEYLQSLESNHPDLFEMSPHGTTHEAVTEFYGASEFGGLSKDDQRDRLAEGEALLAECVDSPSSTFIPPMNTYDATTVEVLAESNYTTVSGGQWFTDKYYDTDNESQFRAGGLLHLPETQAFENWSAYEEAGESEDDDVPFYDLETLTDSFDAAHAENEVHVVMLHYQYFTTDERLEQLESLITHMKGEDDVAFMTIEQYGEGVEAGAIEETDDGWRVLEPISAVSR